MPWKLVLFLICLVVTTVFIGFNLDYTCTVNVLFKTYTDAPISIVVLSSVVFGVIISSLFMISMKLSQKSKPRDTQKSDAGIQQKATSPAMKYNYGDRINLQNPPANTEKKAEPPVVSTPQGGSDA